MTMANDENSSFLSSTDTTAVNTPESHTPRQQSSSSSKIEDVASQAIHKIESIILYAFDQAPPYQQDNHFIVRGYRGELNSFKRCFHSLWYLHNETGNVS